MKVEKLWAASKLLDVIEVVAGSVAAVWFLYEGQWVLGGAWLVIVARGIHICILKRMIDA